jgi:hypothetical protein
VKTDRKLENMLKSLLSLLLSLTILFGSMGISVYKHTCKLFNQTETSFFQPKTCCESVNDNGLAIDVPCCSSEVSQFEIPKAALSLDIDPTQFMSLAAIKEPAHPTSTMGEDLLPIKQPIQIPPLIEEDPQSWNQVYII